MFTRNDVYTATHEKSYFGWGYASQLTINGVDYPIEWVEHSTTGRDWDYTGTLKAVFKINDDGNERFFAKEGYNQSHYGNEWDGDFYECRPVEVTKTDYQEI